ncbi:hypothetical protein [Streptomyces sp. NBC_00996]|uniref:hypothetical protein n=1 Tax=Streptomyces sp. NBC_00996 TaxID=2903710 RepID=UPI003867BF2A|nr:hypothetical protein OG390_00775 [Streptomyces sp. NBC_00996]
MSAREFGAGTAPAHDPLRFPLESVDAAWEHERDARLAGFIAQRLADVEATGCGSERKLAAGVGDVFAEWTRKRELARATDSAPLAALTSALGWLCAASRTARGTERRAGNRHSTRRP